MSQRFIIAFVPVSFATKQEAVDKAVELNQHDVGIYPINQNDFRYANDYRYENHQYGKRK